MYRSHNFYVYEAKKGFFEQLNNEIFFLLFLGLTKTKESKFVNKVKCLDQQESGIWEQVKSETISVI